MWIRTVAVPWLELQIHVFTNICIFNDFYSFSANFYRCKFWLIAIKAVNIFAFPVLNLRFFTTIKWPKSLKHRPLLSTILLFYSDYESHRLWLGWWGRRRWWCSPWSGTSPPGSRSSHLDTLAGSFRISEKRGLIRLESRHSAGNT